MIRKLCDANQLPHEGELKGFSSKTAEATLSLCVGVVGGKVYAIDNICPHARAPLAGGHLAEDIVACPLHGWQWNLRTGKPVRAGDPTVLTYEIRRYGSEVFVRVAGQGSDENKP